MIDAIKEFVTENIGVLLSGILSIITSSISLIVCLIRTRHKKLHEENDIKSSLDLDDYVAVVDDKELPLSSVQFRKKKGGE